MKIYINPKMSLDSILAHDRSKRLKRLEEKETGYTTCWLFSGYALVSPSGDTIVEYLTDNIFELEPIGNLLVQSIEKLFQTGSYDYYTVEGISKNLKVSVQQEIEKALIENPDLFRRAHFSTEDDRILYTSADKKVRGLERLAQFIKNIASLANPDV